LLRAGRYAKFNFEHLLGERNDMGKSERCELESRLLILMARVLSGGTSLRCSPGVGGNSTAKAGTQPSARNASSLLSC
jgi:hypothetical protein